MVACDDYDKWTSSADARLTFSCDTVRFDTIITGQSSSTKTLIAFNNGDAGLRSIAVKLRDGAKSHFRINVDGQYLAGGEGDDFEIRRRDSIVVRIEVLLPEVGDTVIRHYEDQLYFTLENGHTQEVRLQADGMDVQMVHGLIVDHDMTLTDGMPYQVFDSLVVCPGATLTLAPGTRLLFHDNVSLLVHGSLCVNGTTDRPVVLRSDRMDRMFDYLPYDNTPNHWGGVHLYADSHDNVIEYCDLHGGDYGIICDSLPSLDAEHPFLTLRHSMLHNIGGDGLVLRHTSVLVVGTQISNIQNNCVDILGGDVVMVHCTVAQFYRLAIPGNALYLSNLDADEQLVPIRRAHFLNCVFTGYADDVIMGNLAPEYDAPCDYLFANCLLRTEKSDDTDRFRDVVYDNKELEPYNYYDHFVLFDSYNFLYDFTPWKDSPISMIGNPLYSEQYCTSDRYGRPFVVVDSKVPCGAYASSAENKPEEEK